MKPIGPIKQIREKLTHEEKLALVRIESSRQAIRRSAQTIDPLDVDECRKRMDHAAQIYQNKKFLVESQAFATDFECDSRRVTPY